MKRSRSIQPRLSTCCRTLAFCPPPNAVDEIAAKVSAISTRLGFAGLADIRQGPVHNRRRVLAREDMDVNVLGMLVRRQHAHANHEALVVESHDERNFLNSGKEPMPDVRVAKTEIENRWHPFFRNDDDVDFPPLFLDRKS